MAEKKEAQYPGFGSRLVEKYQKSAGANDIEQAAIHSELIKADDAFEKAVEYRNENPGDPKAEEAMNIAREQMQRAYTAAECWNWTCPRNEHSPHDEGSPVVAPQS